MPTEVEGGGGFWFLCFSSRGGCHTAEVDVWLQRLGGWFLCFSSGEGCHTAEVDGEAGRAVPM